MLRDARWVGFALLTACAFGGPLERLKRCSGNVRFTVYPDAGHDAWTRTYENPELYDWFLQHRRQPAP